jgi:hypothetical protein
MTLLLVVTISSMLLAATMSAIAWRIAAKERRRSDARVAVLAAEIHAPAAKSARVASFSGQRSTARWDDDLPIRPVVEHRADAPDLFAGQAQRSRTGSALAAGMLVVAGAIALLVVLGRGWPQGRGAAASEPPRAAAAPPVAADTRRMPAAPAVVPLELVALGHDRDGDRLTVRGVVRNPATGAAVDQLSAVVFVFSADGGFLTSGRAIIESAALRPGDESTFVVVVPGAAGVARYRVSFRSGDHVVPHADRREPPRASS